MAVQQENYDYIAFWNANGKLNHKTFVSNMEDTESSHIYYTYIDSVVHVKQISGDDLYLITGSSDDRFTHNQHIFCYKISPSREITIDASVFKVGSKILSQIDVDCLPPAHESFPISITDSTAQILFIVKEEIENGK